MKGVFITIYGINNIGKSTHCRLLVDKLKAARLDAVYIKYPIYDLEPTGGELNRILRSDKQSVGEKDLQTLFMQNRKDYEPALKKMLADGKIVIAEDYTATGIAWGTAKGLDPEFMADLNENLLKEDFTILLTGQRSMFAVEQKHIHEKNDRLVNNVGKILLSMASEKGWKILEIRPHISDTALLIFGEVKAFLAQKGINF
jgi:thymidylate kinase